MQVIWRFLLILLMICLNLVVIGLISFIIQNFYNCFVFLVHYYGCFLDRCLFYLKLQIRLKAFCSHEVCFSSFDQKKTSSMHRDPFSIIAMAPRGTFELCCVYIAQLMTHAAIYTLPFTLQLRYKSLDILQRITKGQKVHISSHDRPYTKTKIIFTCILITITETSFCNNNMLQTRFRITRTFIYKSQKVGSVIRSRFRLKVHFNWTFC